MQRKTKYFSMMPQLATQAIGYPNGNAAVKTLLENGVLCDVQYSCIKSIM